MSTTIVLGVPGPMPISHGSPLGRERRRDRFAVARALAGVLMVIGVALAVSLAWASAAPSCEHDAGVVAPCDR